MQIGRKIYYDKLTGNVLVDTGERLGSVRETTTEEDYQTFIVLSERVSETVGVAQLEYGQYSQDFRECNGYRVNPDSLTLEFSYPNPNDPQPELVYQKPLSEEFEQQKSEIELLQEKYNTLQGAIDFIIMNF